MEIVIPEIGPVVFIPVDSGIDDLDPVFIRVADEFSYQSAGIRPEQVCHQRIRFKLTAGRKKEKHYGEKSEKAHAGENTMNSCSLIPEKH
jgi:hypothetical protein